MTSWVVFTTVAGGGPEPKSAQYEGATAAPTSSKQGYELMGDHQKKMVAILHTTDMPVQRNTALTRAVLHRSVNLMAARGYCPKQHVEQHTPCPA